MASTKKKNPGNTQTPSEAELRKMALGMLNKGVHDAFDFGRQALGFGLLGIGEAWSAAVRLAQVIPYGEGASGIVAAKQRITVAKGVACEVARSPEPPFDFVMAVYERLFTPDGEALEGVERDLANVREQIIEGMTGLTVERSNSLTLPVVCQIIIDVYDTAFADA